MECCCSCLAAILLGIAGLLAYLFLFVWNDEERCRLERLLKRKQNEREAELKIYSAKYKLNEKAERIVALKWDELVKTLQDRKLTAVEVLEAYIAKALESTKKSNNVTEFIPKAMEWAKELDALPQPKGPLHGVPFCVKEEMDVEGMDTTIGFAKYLFKPKRENAVIVQVLMDLGAVPFCKTNIPQTMSTYGSDNPVFGTTTNAHNPKLSPGGSSSGTGSLVGAGGAMFGTGSDIGGSLRIPSHFNGAATVKPTCGRVSVAGLLNPVPNLVGIHGISGIIGQNPKIVSSVYKGLFEGLPLNKYDPLTLPIPWNEAAFNSKEKLRIGFYTNLPFFPAMGDTEEVVLRAKAQLESLGHTLIPVKMPNDTEYMQTIGRIMLADNSKTLRASWKGERVAKSMQLTFLLSFIPIWAQRILAKLMELPWIPFLYSTRTSLLLGCGAKNCVELWDAEGVRQKVQKEILEEWRKQKVDAVLCPVFPFPAIPKDLPGMIPAAIVYTMIWNLVDFPAGVIPFGKESGKNIAKYNTEGDVALKLAKEGIKESIGAPIGVQIVARPFQEELILRLMCELEPYSNQD